MDGPPEGTARPRGLRWRGRPVWLVVAVGALVVYLAFRMVEGVVWVIGLL
ncbi:MAG: hypothetical protein L0K86_10645 [Actinomycetia bacterium]|nr:hypothetical protein [Actinomycetes bacterium]